MKIKATVFLLLLSSIAFSSPALDSLVLKSKNEETNARKLKGFGFNRQVQLTPPEILFKTLAAPAPVPEAAPAPANVGHGSGIMNYRVTVLENKLAELEKNEAVSASNEAKMTTVLESLQKQSESHTDNVNIIMRILETLMGAIATIIVSYLGYRFKRKK